MKRVGLVIVLIVLMFIPSLSGYAEQGDKTHAVLAKKLSASPDEFVGKEIVLQCYFSELSTFWLNHDRVHFPSVKYIEFVIRGVDGSVYISTNFVKKNKGEILYGLKDKDKITIYGKVVSSYIGKPWIEIYEIKMGWK